jgi:plastocyanin
MTGRLIGIIVVIIIVAAGAWYLLAGPGAGAPAGSGTAASPVAPAATVVYTDQGFSPDSVTVSQGETVAWVNQSSENLWVASDPHPLHDGYDGTTRSEHCAAGYQGPTPFDSCAMIPPGASWAFAFGQAGTWGYHNHANDDMQSSVIVLAASSTEAAPMIPASTTESVSASVSF